MFGGLALRNQLLCHGTGETAGRVRLVDLRTGLVKRAWGFGNGGEGWSGVGGLTLDRDSSILVADPEGGLVRRFSLFGAARGEVGVPRSRRGERLFWDRRGVLDHPNDVALDGRGNLFVCCGDRPLVHGVQSFTAEGRYRFSCRAFGEPLEEWGLPMGLAVARDRLFVADTFNQCIQVFALDGTFRMMFSTASRQGERSLPVAVAVRRDGQILVAQWRDRPAVLRFNPSGWFEEELVGPGEGEGRVHGLAAIQVDGRGHLFVLDRGGDRIQEFDPGGRLVRLLPAE